MYCSVRLSIPLFIVLDICWLVEAAFSEPLQGSLARCSDDNDVIALPILAGNPCIACRCQKAQVICIRHRCPSKANCRGDLKRVPGKCCPLCVESSMCLTPHKSYKDGQRWYEPNCRVCQCTNKTIHCGRQQCSRELKCSKGYKPGLLPGSCCLQCIEETGVCTSYGDPHFETFDGKMYNFRGNCRYKLAADCKDENFTIRMRNERRPSKSRAKSLTISIGSTHISLQQRGHVIRVNRSHVHLPFYKLPFLQISKENFVVTVLTDIGLKILWDGDSFIEVHVPKRFQGQTCGLCGNFNSDPEDDFTLRNGQITTSVHAFGANWEIGRQRNVCKRAPAPPRESAVCKLRQHWRAKKRCLPIKTQFSNCHKKVSPHKYYKSCISDVCSCKNKRCECESLLAYARACRRTGTNVRWGKRKACGMACKGGSVFDDCVPSCKATCRTKEDPSFACPNQHCVPGCRCPAGQVWDERARVCIFTWMCPAPVSTHRT